MRAVLLCAELLLVAACSHGQGALVGAGTTTGKTAGRSHDAVRGQKTQLSGDDEGGPAAGTWDWVLRSTDEGGNMRVEQEEWHLTQVGRAIEGDYDRAVTLLSTDDRLFQCNQQLGYTRFTHVRVAGTVEHGRVSLKETSFEARPGPCDDGARTLASYDGELSTSTLLLRFGASPGQQTLYRRKPDTGARLADLVGAEEKPGHLYQPPPGPPSAAVTGSWAWLLKSIDAEGDERVEDEAWHLEEREGGIRGYYERKVRRTRQGGVFSCNRDNKFETSTRYEIEGHRVGDVITLTETAFSASRDQCDNGLRRLDTYQGSVSSSGDELILSWGSGNQILRRQPSRTANDVIR